MTENRGRNMDLSELFELEDALTKQIAISSEETGRRLTIFRDVLFEAFNNGEALVYENDDDFDADFGGEDLEWTDLDD